MPKGGARTTSGPAPDPGSARTARTVGEWTTLPLRDGVGIDVPPWPVPGEHPSEAEQTVWESMWLTYPQAAIWERDNMQLQVAAYVRIWMMSMTGKRSAIHASNAKQLASELLISTHALRAAKCVIAGSADAAALASHTPPSANVEQGPVQGSARTRFTVVKASGE